MATVHTTRQGETVDLVCFSYYGRTSGTVEAVLEANRGLSALGPILPIGTKILLPDMPSVSTARPLTSLWD